MSIGDQSFLVITIAIKEGAIFEGTRSETKPLRKIKVILPIKRLWGLVTSTLIEHEDNLQNDLINDKALRKD